ncbi:hypothetical protein Tco_1068010 [Tanacetum coccineum]|uniref:Uncharacterized protein n=1 Tax=Tanacetum coccineum TaxID=301880 RepID=A0ABQ5HEN4_9ASTR
MPLPPPPQPHHLHRSPTIPTVAPHRGHSNGSNILYLTAWVFLEGTPLHLEWHEEPNDVPEQSWFNDMVNAQKGPVTFDDIMGSVNYIELEYNFEECYRALTDQTDWINPEGERITYDLSKPLSLQGPPGCTTIPVNFFFNKYLEYLKNGSTKRRHASSLTKPKATRLSIDKQFDYGCLKEIGVRRANHKEYVFNEADFK